MTDGEPRRSWPVMALAVLTLAVAATHGFGLRAPFHYDDKLEILLNPNFNGFGHWREIWAYNPFRFLLLCTFSVQYNTTGLQTWPFHLVNLAIHALNCALVVSLAGRALTAMSAGAPSTAEIAWRYRLGALFAGVLFGVHPLLIEGVTYISGRSSSLATTFYLAALVLLDTILRMQAEAPDRGVRFRAVARRVSLLVSLVIALLLLGAVVAALLTRHELVAPGRAVFLGFGVTLAGCGGCSVLIRRILAVPLPTGPPSGPLVIRWALLGALFVTGAMVKEIVVTLPVALWLWELCFHHRGRLRPALASLWGFHLPLFVVPLGLALFRMAYYGSLLSPDMLRPMSVNLWTEAEVVWRYVGLFLWPAGLSIFHDHPESAGPGSWPTWLALAGLALTTGGALWSLRRRPALAFVVLWTLVALSPTSSVLPLKETMAEHRAYLPAAGWCVAMALLLFGRDLGRRWILLAAVCAVALGALAVRNVTYTRLWLVEEHLWQNAVERNPHAADAWYMLGDIARAERRLGEAETRYRRCIDADPDHADAQNNLGLVFAEQGELDEAYVWFIRARNAARRRGRCYPSAYNNIANVMSNRENYLDAADQFNQALQCDPDNFVAHVGMGNLFYGPLENRELAMKHYRNAVRLYPTHPTSQVLMQRIEELSW